MRSSSDLIWRVVDVRKDGEQIVHTAVLLQHPSELGSWEALTQWIGERGGLQLLGTVEDEVRLDTARNHTATHILHAALKKILGEHVMQAGSLVAPDRLRFDFTHFAGLSDRALADIESLVNREILDDVRVVEADMDLDEALFASILTELELPEAALRELEGLTPASYLGAAAGLAVRKLDD